MSIVPTSSINDSRAAEIIKTHQELANNRSSFESHWREVGLRVWPSHSKNFNSMAGLASTQGGQVNQEMYDSTAAIALGRFGAILDSLLTPRNNKWHKLQASDPMLNRHRAVQLYFEEVTKIVFKYRYAPLANFSAQNQQNYKSLGAFGTGCVYVDELGSEPGLRYKALHLREIYFRENHQGIVDTALRHFPLTARQAIQRFKEACPPQVKEALPLQPDREFMFLHFISPNSDRDMNRLDYRGQPFLSEYVSIEGQQVVETKGYRAFPCAISRYEQDPGELYGRSPAMQVLPSIKTLNEKAKTLLKQGHRAVDPVLLTHDDGIIDGFSIRPGSLNPGGVTADGKLLVHALPTGRVDIGKDLMDDDRQAINDAFLVTLFQILVETPQRTATEVMELAKEKGILLAPTIGRQQSEYLGPLIVREIDCLRAQNLLPPMPRILQEAGANYEVEYDSPLSRAMRAEEASGLMRTLETAINVAAQTGNPEPLDHFDWDAIMPEVAAIQGVPTKWMRGIDAVKAIREGRAKAAEAEQMNNAAPGAAAMINAATKSQQALPRPVN